MRLACLVLWIAPALAAATYPDLSGEWRWTTTDDPQYSQPDFGDRAWQKVTLPRGERLRLRSRDWVQSDYLWVRRTVDVDTSGSEEPLALTMGALQEAYQVFVNGVRVGTTGPFDLRTLAVARPRTFVLPPEVHGSRLVIAIRLWNPILQGWRGLLLSDTGPWLLTPASLAPPDIGLAAIDRRRVDRTADLVQSVIVLVLCVIVLLIWTYDRRRRELLWLGLYWSWWEAAGSTIIRC